MPAIVKRSLVGRGKGRWNASGPQVRFIVFLLIVLVVYTFLLNVFQKLAELAESPLLLPIALVILLFFIAIAGAIYAHTFVGPMVRIRRALERLADGNSVAPLRLRDADDPVLKDLVAAITRLCEHNRKAHIVVQETALELIAGLEALRKKSEQGADSAELQKHLAGLHAKQDLLEKAIKAYGER